MKDYGLNKKFDLKKVEDVVVNLYQSYLSFFSSGQGSLGNIWVYLWCRIRSDSTSYGGGSST